MVKASCSMRSSRPSRRSTIPGTTHRRSSAEHSLGHLRDAVALLKDKATPEECEQYKSFILKLAERVAAAHKEGGSAEEPVSDPERAAIASITQALG